MENTVVSKSAKTTLDPVILKQSLRSGKTLRLPDQAKLALSAVPILDEIPFDCIELATTVHTLARHHQLAAQLGQNLYPVRNLLCRYDWDLIHELLIESLYKIPHSLDTRQAVVRCLSKVHEQRVWLQKVDKIIWMPNTTRP